MFSTLCFCQNVVKIGNSRVILGIKKRKHMELRAWKNATFTSVNSVIFYFIIRHLQGEGVSEKKIGADLMIR